MDANDCGRREGLGHKGIQCKIKEQGESGGKEWQGQRRGRWRRGREKACPGKGAEDLGFTVTELMYSVLQPWGRGEKLVSSEK